MSDTPEHYSAGGITPWDYCAAKFPESFDDHLLITAVEYISRARHKAGAEDIRKAHDNLGHWLKRNEPEPQPEPDQAETTKGVNPQPTTWRIEHNLSGKWKTLIDWGKELDLMREADMRWWAKRLRDDARRDRYRFICNDTDMECPLEYFLPEFKNKPEGGAA